MTSVLVPIADGFEEIETTTIVDVLRRASIDVTLAAVGETLVVVGAQRISLLADVRLVDVAASTPFDAIVLSGGKRNAESLRDDATVQRWVRALAEAGKLIAAICAAPIALERAGLLSGRRATSYPGFALPSAFYVEESVVEDGPVLTSRGVGTALPFALALVARLVDAQLAQTVGERMLVAR